MGSLMALRKGFKKIRCYRCETVILYSHVLSFEFESLFHTVYEEDLKPVQVCLFCRATCTVRCAECGLVSFCDCNGFHGEDTTHCQEHKVEVSHG